MKKINKNKNKNVKLRKLDKFIIYTKDNKKIITKIEYNILESSFRGCFNIVNVSNVQKITQRYYNRYDKKIYYITVYDHIIEPYIFNNVRIWLTDNIEKIGYLKRDKDFLILVKNKLNKTGINLKIDNIKRIEYLT